MSLDFTKSRQTYRELFGVDMPQEVEMFIAKICILWNIKPDNIEIIHYIVNGWLKDSIKDIPRSLELLIATIPQYHQQSLGVLNKSLIEHSNAIAKTFSGYSTSIEKSFTEETQRRSEQIADACAIRLEAVLANSRAPLVANIWLSLITALAACSATLGVMWIIYSISAHGWLSLAFAVSAFLAQWGAPFCRWFWKLIYNP